MDDRLFVIADLLAIKDIRIFAGTNLLVLAGLIAVAAAILREQKNIKAMKERGELPE